MPKYMSLFSFKGETLGRLMDNPSNREDVVRGLVEKVGGSLEAYYVMMGQHDGCVIVEAPDSTSAAAAVVAAAGSGAFAHIETHELFTAGQFIEILEKARSITGFQAPGA